jgi:hypothetical protein
VTAEVRGSKRESATGAARSVEGSMLGVRRKTERAVRLCDLVLVSTGTGQCR